jgi:dihydrodipicolinate synthase/N-acetylneuraminate lyase
MMVIDPLKMLKPKRKIMGISAMLLPYLENGDVDWQSYAAHLQRTVEAGLMPAINMDTGYGPLLSTEERQEVLRRSASQLQGVRFAAGVVVCDQPGSGFARETYLREIETIQQHGGIPVICQSYGLTSLPNYQLVDAYREIGQRATSFIAFELGTMFAPFGKIYSIEVYRELLQIKSCLGAKHSSLSRELEWQRLMLRDAVRPTFHVFTGNDLAIDMVMYGSDYLLGLSTFAPELFARRDHYWELGDVRFHELNDKLQYLGAFAFRPPVPAYKHSAAQFLHLTGCIQTSQTHPRSPRRPESDVEILREMATSLELAG